MYELISNQFQSLSYNFPNNTEKTTKVQLRFKFTLYTFGTINSDKTANVTSRIYYFSWLIKQLDNPYFFIWKRKILFLWNCQIILNLQQYPIRHVCFLSKMYKTCQTFLHLRLDRDYSLFSNKTIFSTLWLAPFSAPCLPPSQIWLIAHWVCNE